MSQLKDLSDCAKWIDNGSSASVAGTASTLFPASNVTGVGALQTNKQNATRFVEVYNAEATNPIFASIYNAGETARPATLNSRVIPPKSYRRFKVPQGSGQGILSVLAAANANCAISWGIGSG